MDQNNGYQPYQAPDQPQQPQQAQPQQQTYQAPQQPYQQQYGAPQQPYQQPYGAPYQTPYQPTAPVEGRSLAVYIILSLVTCGIFAIYWRYTLHNDSTTLSGRLDISAGVAILLSIVTCGIYTIIWSYQLGEKIAAIKAARGIPASNEGILYLLLTIFGLGIVTFALAQNEINNAIGYQG